MIYEMNTLLGPLRLKTERLSTNWKFGGLILSMSKFRWARSWTIGAYIMSWWHQHTVASSTNWSPSLLSRKPRLPSMSLSLSPSLSLYLCLTVSRSHSLSLASLPSIQRCRTCLLVRRLPQGRWWDVRDHFPGGSCRRHRADGAAQPAPEHQVLRQPCQVGVTLDFCQLHVLLCDACCVACLQWFLQCALKVKY